MYRQLLILWCVLCGFGSMAQAQNAKKYTFTHGDTLRGSLSPERACYDVRVYDLNLRVQPRTHFLSGYNQITFQVVQACRRIQLDLFDNMNIDSIVWRGQKLNFSRENDVFWVRFPEELRKGSRQSIRIYYNGQPQKAANPPWDGGLVWRKDPDGLDWVGVACEGLGASVWFPCKDHLSDEPDSTYIRCEVPAELTCVANGQFLGQKNITDSTARYDWLVSYPINNYNITLNIARYAHIADTFRTAAGNVLKLDYYVLKNNKDIAAQHFKQVKPMLKCYEKYFGEYPFVRDGYKLVETPYWGMEHQSCVAYGNAYKNNKQGFDFIIIHESGHEYWGNSLSCTDHAEMWIHESFCTYAEAIYIEELWGKEKTIEYLKEQRKRIGNKEPMLAPLGVNYNYWDDSDNYFKGTWMLHTLRHALHNDALWWELIRGLNKEFLRSPVTTAQIIDFFERKAPNTLHWRPLFEAYLRYAQPPQFEYKLEQNTEGTWQVAYRWNTAEMAFDMPVEVSIGGSKFQRLQPRTQWQYVAISAPKDPKKFEVQVNTDLFYVGCKALK
ncbi:aminopeptidase N [Flexibacter flexilis DSM 6793]|uniref:Aminopeptidase N n=1 Tax=Flexibacter flexilis DSM 6793 TaxID=927664 RepID=A0A1I1L763_9BACT|nr:M1 family metallopeptidase [Flexibacter flexilis]SFC68342.1 aminopeptidase N [Flexibacter flexilis DSM 6793]